MERALTQDALSKAAIFILDNDFNACIACIVNRPVAAASVGAPPIFPWHLLVPYRLVASVWAPVVSA